MITDERIQRLTELAQKAWNVPGLGVQHVEQGMRARVVTRHGTSFLEVQAHPRALDALEVALLVLALPETGAESAKSVLDLCRANIELGMALVELRLKLMELADHWREMARAETEDIDGDPAVAMARKLCAADLRDVLRGPS